MKNGIMKNGIMKNGMKRLSVQLVLLMVLLCIAVPALASNDVRGVRYRVNITMPAGKDHIYLYDEPSSSKGKNLGRIDNGDYVTGISSVERNGYTWIYCNYDGIKGYIRKNNLVKVSGGSESNSSGYSRSHHIGSSSNSSASIPASAKDLSDYEYLTVRSKGRGSLVFQQSPGGKFISGHRYYDGDQIYVNIYYRKSGYAVAYDNGVYGYVDASYIDWDNGAGVKGRSTGATIPAAARDLDDYDWYKVRSRGRGSLVFQERPRGEFIEGHTFYDGEWIYVNPDYRKDGYVVAYDDGVFGFVDASYIDWNS